MATPIAADRERRARENAIALRGRNDPNFGLWEMEVAEATERRCALRITRCLYAQFWRELGHAEIGYQIQCRCDFAWVDRPAWNPAVRFECPATLMQGDDYCLLVQYLPDEG